jgi:hypothetical protein
VLCLSALESPGLSSHTRAVLGSQPGLIELRRGGDAAPPYLTSATSGGDPARLGWPPQSRSRLPRPS